MDQQTLKKALSLLGMATRAGKLVSGEEQVLTAIQRNKLFCVICATDCSPKTVKKIQNKCQHYEIPFIQPFDSATISQAIGKNRSICGISDKGFSKSLLGMEGITIMKI